MCFSFLSFWDYLSCLMLRLLMQVEFKQALVSGAELQFIVEVIPYSSRTSLLHFTEEEINLKL